MYIYFFKAIGQNWDLRNSNEFYGCQMAHSIFVQFIYVIRNFEMKRHCIGPRHGAGAELPLDAESREFCTAAVLAGCFFQ